MSEEKINQKFKELLDKEYKGREELVVELLLLAGSYHSVTMTSTTAPHLKVSALWIPGATSVESPVVNFEVGCLAGSPVLRGKNDLCAMAVLIVEMGSVASKLDPLREDGRVDPSLGDYKFLFRQLKKWIEDPSSKV